MAKIKIFATHHKEGAIIESPWITNVRVGKMYNPPDSNMPGNDEGTNIGERANTFNELVTQYWAWKNFDLDYYGFCHYRRYISFGEEQESDIYGNVIFKNYNENIPSMLGYDRLEIEDEIRKHDIILVEGFNTKNANCKNLYKQYGCSDGLYLKDLECAIEILKEKYPEYSDVADQYMKGHILYPCNMFIMRKEIFLEYCEWLFDILFELERRIDTTNYSIASLRMIGHVGERLLGIFVWYQKKLYDYSISVKQRFLILDMSEFKYPAPHYENNNVPVIFSTNDAFAPYVASALNSLIQTSDESYNYDIFILNSGLSIDSKNTISSVARGCDNVHLEFLNITGFIENYNLIPNAHISVETFYRLFAPELFVNFDKMVYLDADIIIQTDISELYNTDIGDNLLGGVIDPDFLAQYNGFRPEIKPYALNELELKNPYVYCQAGVLIFNLKEMRNAFRPFELVEACDDKFYIYGDQDVLNKKCQGRIHYVDMAWNVMHSCNGTRTKIIGDYTPAEVAEAYFASRKNPHIIHYAGDSKPWNNPNDDYAEVYWESIKNTEIYEKILFGMRCNKSGELESHEDISKNQPRLKEPFNTGFTKLKDMAFRLFNKSKYIFPKLFK